MPWKASSVMEERLRFVARLPAGPGNADGVDRYQRGPVRVAILSSQFNKRIIWIGNSGSELSFFVIAAVLARERPACVMRPQ
jgi:hypothetical protein